MARLPRRLRTPTQWRPFYQRVHVPAQPAVSTATLTQEGFRWRNDDGSETTATWKAAQDANTTLALDTPVRLRVLLDATGDPDPFPPTLYYKKTTDSTWLPVPVGASPTPAPLLAYNFSETGTTVTDRSGNGRDAVMLADSTPTDLHSGGELSTTATLQKLSYDAASDAAARPVNASVTLKMRMPGSSANFNLWSRMRSVGSSTFNLYVNTGTLSAVVRGVGGGGATVISDGALSVGTTYQLALTYDGTTTRLYRDGVEVSSSTTTAGDLDWTGTNFKWQSGDHEEDTIGGSPMFVDDIRFFDVALTAPQVAAFAATPVSDLSPVYIAPSANVTASGQATTALLTPPGSKTTADFSVGRMWDDENGTDLIDIGGAPELTVTTDLIVHLDASTLTLTNGDPVSTWEDQSPVGTNDATQTGTNRPTYIASGLNGLPTVRFDGTTTNDYMVMPSGFSTWTAGWTWFLVAQPAATPINNEKFLSFSSGGSRVIACGRDGTTSAGILFSYNSSDAVRYFYSSAGLSPASTGAVYSFHNPAGTADAAVSGEMRKGNVSFGTGDTYIPPVVTRSDNFIGVSWFGPEHYNGDFSEILVYNRALTEGEITSVYAYLNDKYGL